MIGTLTHILFCLVAQFCIAATTGSYWLGVVSGTCYYLGREVAQAEARWNINVGDRYGPGLWRKLRAFDPRAWDVKALADWIGPLLATGAVAAYLEGFGG